MASFELVLRQLETVDSDWKMRQQEGSFDEDSFMIALSDYYLKKYIVLRDAGIIQSTVWKPQT